MRVCRELKVDVNKVIGILVKQDLFGKIICENGTEKNIKISAIATNGRYLSVYYDDPTKNPTVDVDPSISFKEN